MAKYTFVLILVSFFCCNSREDTRQFRKGKYYAAHGFLNEYIIVNKDSSYNHYLDGKLWNTARWSFLQQRNKFSFRSYLELLDTETGEPKIDPDSGTRLFIYRGDGVLDAGLENMSYIHESLWDSVCKTRR
jgi:hypothetical protein